MSEFLPRRPSKPHSAWPEKKEVGEIYTMNSEKRGICLIVNNFHFEEPSLEQRCGTMVDADCLEKVFEWLGFEVRIRQDCNRKQILSLIQELSSNDHSQMDCLVCCVLSHGKEDCVCGVDGRTVKITELMKPFNGQGCNSLVGKPKLFFIQACQGSERQKPVFLVTDSHTDEAAGVKISIPCDADFLLAVSSIPSYVSYRNPTHGARFIQSLCQNLIKMVPRNCHVVDILTKVNGDVSQMGGWWGSKQMPRYDSCLRKNVVFPVPKESPPKLR
ncbi:caspase-8 isoform X2 [Vanacampus margaritifer]